MAFSQKRRLLYLIILAVSIGLISTVYLYQYQMQNSIYVFDEQRDYNDLKSVIEENWYWLLPSDDYDIDYMIKNRAPKDPRFFGKLKFGVMRKNDQFIGFVGYFKENFYVGRILFLAVGKDFRGHGYAQKLLHYGIEQLKKEGALRVILLTRTDNMPAQKLYKKVGFKETDRDDQYVNYELFIEK